MTAYIAALRTAYDTLLAHMATEGGVPMTDELAGAIATVEEYDENAPLRNMAPLAVRVPRLPVRPEAHPALRTTKAAP